MRIFLLSILLLGTGCTSSAPDVPPVDSVDSWTLADRPLPATVAADVRAGGALTAFARDGHVYVQRVTADGRLSEPVVLTPEGENAATHAQAPAQIAVAPGGAVLVAWVRQIPVEGRRFPASELRVTRSDDGGRTFSAPFTASDGGGMRTSHHFHDLLVAPDGTVYLSWLDSRTRDAARQQGAAEVPGTELRVARSRNGGRSFEASVVAAHGTCECCRTTMALGPDGDLFVAWRHQFEPDVRDVAVARSTDGGQTFSAPVRLPAPAWHLEGCPHTGPALAVAADGAVHATWFTGAAAAPGLYHAVSTDGAQTFSGGRIEESGHIAQVQMAMEADGPLVLWESSGARGLRLSRGTSFSEADTLDGRGPEVSVGPSTVWLVRQTDTATLLERRGR